MTKFTYEMLFDGKATQEWVIGGAIDAAAKAMRENDSPIPVHVIEAICIYAMEVAGQITSCAIRGPNG
jgi:leucyl aminopeptidase (aminopeptidase T)